MSTQVRRYWLDMRPGIYTLMQTLRINGPPTQEELISALQHALACGEATFQPGSDGDASVTIVGEVKEET